MKIIQQYVFPESKGIEEALYCRTSKGNVSIDYKKKSIQLEKDSIIPFNTYLNSYVKTAYESVLNGPEYFSNVDSESFHLENKRKSEEFWEKQWGFDSL